MKLYQRLQMASMPGWVLLPLRLFLGITFIYAGIQKLTDPQYFNPTTPGYIGKQVIAFATGSPIHGFLIQFVVPHAHFFGALVAYGELAIGLGALFGFLLRPAAFFGALLSLLFFLSASWRIHPYFYGADIVFFFSWITLLLNGPINTGLPTLDVLLVSHLIQSIPPQRQVEVARVLHILLGTGELSVPESVTATAPQTSSGKHGIAQKGKQAVIRRTQQQKTRRSFLLGILTGGAAMLGISLFGFTILREGGNEVAVARTTTTPITGNSDDDGGRLPTQTTPQPGNTSSTSTVIAQVSAVPANSALTFTIASTGDPGVLVHLDNGQFVAYDSLCTHAGCPVDYDPGSQLLVCPCHGAAFDPAKNAAVVQGPADTPLVGVTIHIDSTGNITM